MDQPDPETFRLYVILMAIGTAISSLIPALLMKWLMSAMFGHRVSFWLVLLMLILSASIFVAVLYALGIFDIVMAEGEIPLEVNLLLSVAVFCIQLLLLTLFVPDEDLQLVSMWKWAVVCIAQVIVLVLFAILFGVLIGVFARGLGPLPG